MTDEATTTATETEAQTATATEDQASTQTETATEASAEQQKPEPAKDEAYLKKIRDEAAENRTKLRAAEKRLKELENEKLGETERTKKQAEEAQARADALEARVKRAEIAKAAADKVSNPNLAADLIDPSKVELDDDGNATNAAELIDALLERYPDLKPVEAADERKSELKQVLKDGDLVEKAKGMLSAEQALHLAKTDPDKFNEHFEAGRIPASALGAQR